MAPDNFSQRLPYCRAIVNAYQQMAEAEARVATNVIRITVGGDVKVDSRTLWQDRSATVSYMLARALTSYMQNDDTQAELLLNEILGLMHLHNPPLVTRPGD